MAMTKKFDYDGIYAELKKGSSGEAIMTKFGVKKPTLKNIHYALMTEKGEFLILKFSGRRSRKAVSDVVSYNKQGIRLPTALLKVLDVPRDSRWKVGCRNDEIVLTKA